MKYVFLFVVSLLSLFVGIAANDGNANDYQIYEDSLLGFSLEVPVSWKKSYKKYHSFEELKKDSYGVTVLDQVFSEHVSLLSIEKDGLNNLEVSCSPYNYLDENKYQDYVTKYYEISLSILKEEGVLFQYRAGSDTLNKMQVYSLYVRVLDKADNSIIAEQRHFNFYSNGCSYSVSGSFNSDQNYRVLQRVLDSFEIEDQ